MMNQVLLAGRIHHFTRFKDGASLLVLKVKRPFMNSDGEYEYDFIPIQLSQWFTDVSEAIGLNKLIFVRGRVVIISSQLFIQADKITMIEGCE